MKKIVQKRLLTSTESKVWHKNGFLLFKGILSKNEILLMRKKILEISEKELLSGKKDILLTNLIDFSPIFDSLLDRTNLFSKILGLMGPYIQIQGTEALVRFQNFEGALKIHTDGGPSLSRIFPHKKSLVLQLKIQFFLTDVSDPNHGNMIVVPRSHVWPFNDSYVSRNQQEYTQILAESGDAILFPWSLWHGAAKNISSSPRVSIIIRYSQIWHRTVGYERINQTILQRLSQRQRYLLGDFSDAERLYGYYYPPSDDFLDVIFGELRNKVKEWEEYRIAHEISTSLLNLV